MKIKTIIATLFLSIGLAHAQTNNQTNAPAQTNLNEVIIQMLSGVKSVSGEVYDTSKETIHKSVDFVVQQTPDIVHQFLAWKSAEAICAIGAFLAVLLVFSYLGKKLSAYEKEENCEPAYGFGIALRIIGMIIFLVGFFVNIFNLVEIWIAPKIYIIEYVVDLIKEAHAH